MDMLLRDSVTHQDTFLLGRTHNFSPTPRVVWHVAATVKLSQAEGIFPTVDHHSVVNPRILSIQFTVGPRKAGTDWDEKIALAGQVVPDERRILRRPDPAKYREGERSGYDERHIIDLLWREWHMNHMKAGCAHQKDPAYMPSMPDLYSHIVPPCPVTGYRWGSQLLVHPLDEDALSRIALLDLTPVVR